MPIRRSFIPVLRWASAGLSVYLTLFFWVDAIMRAINQRTVPPPSSLLILVAAAVACRALWVRNTWSWILSAALAAGLCAADDPWLLFVPVLFAVTVALRAYQARLGQTVVAYRLKFPWPISLTTADRFLHMHVLGPTGSGKSSSVLMPLIAQDIAHHYGIIVIEPKGDLSQSAYRQAVKNGRSVIRFTPTDAQCPHFNPLNGPADTAAEGLALCLDQLSPGGHPYYAVATRVQLLHAVRVIKATLGESADIGHLLTFFRDSKQQRHLVAACRDASAQQYFQEQWSRKSTASREDHQGLLNRLELLWANPTVRRVLSAPADFTWDEVLRERWIVLCALSLADLGESARALGVLIWHSLAQAAYRRDPAVPHPPFFVYLDEFYQWVSEDIGDFLALARGYSLGLILAHQDLGQLTEPLKQAVMANARQRIILPGTAADDVARFRQGAQPYAVDPRTRYLHQGQALVQMTQRGRLRPPCLVRLTHVALASNGRHA